MFTTSCFIRKNTPELRKKLEVLGYKPRISCINDGRCLIAGNIFYRTEHAEKVFYDGTLQSPNVTHGTIDCGDNEELFLALAALRDDSDYMQWFCGKGWVRDNHNLLGAREEFVWWICNARDQHERYEKGVLLHKATPSELIEHFKN